MKELSTEEKAKAYDEALERAKSVIEQNPLMEYLKKGIEYIFLELKESKDEKIRKAFIDTIKFWGPVMDSPYMLCISKEDILAWLENQGEHASFRNKIQVGDKVTRNKDGVLVNLSQLNRVAKKDERQGEQKPIDVDYNPFDDFRKSDSEINPSEFDARLNTLLKEFESLPKEELVNSLAFYLNVVQNDGTYNEQKPAWSEEDEEMYKKIETAINSYYAPFSRDAEEMSDWLKSLKDRVQPKQEWSEENESRITTMCIYLQDYARLSGSESRTIRINEYCDWLKSLKPQSQWKPSDEQMIQLKRYCPDNRPLTSLYEQLKKLREE